MIDEAVEKASDRLRKARKVLAFTGAGLSTESGIPDFRSPGGIWDRDDPSDFEFQKIVSSETSRRKYWKMSTEFYETMRDARPNPAHLALETLEAMGKLTAIVTQNIDNLHQMDDLADVVLRGSMGVLLPRIVERSERRS